MGANAKENIEMAASCNRITEYVDSGFSESYYGYDKELLKKDWSRIRSILIPGSKLRIQTVFKGLINADNNLTESLKWIAGYINSGYNKIHLNFYFGFAVNKCALITRILDSSDEHPAPLSLLSYKAEKIFKKALINNIYRKDEHQEVTSEVFFETNYSPEKIKKILKDWDPLKAGFTTYLYRNMSDKKNTLINKTDSHISIDSKNLDALSNLRINVAENIKIDLYHHILFGLLMLTGIRPHKKLFFLITNTIYQCEKKIDAEGFYDENCYKELEHVYNKFFENTEFWEIRNLLNDFYKNTLSLMVDKIYDTERKDDKNILKLAGDKLVKDTLVKIYFNDCINNRGEPDYTKITQRLSTWNLHIKNTVRQKMVPVYQNSNFFV